MDEVGRGPLAGPVATCALYIKANLDIPKELLLIANDSKKLTHKKREYICDYVKNISGIKYVVFLIDNKEIDRINILNAALNAFKKSVLLLEEEIQHKPDLILIDGNRRIPNFDKYNQKLIVKGDSKIFSIALASIVAKEYRDNLMIKYSKKYCEYGFEQNKGYGTERHIKAIKEFGLCKIHRKSFVKNILK
jgi:ribonuclease HII